MHGGLRVTLELIDKLIDVNCVDIHFSVNRKDPVLLRKLQRLVTDVYSISKSQIVNCDDLGSKHSHLYTYIPPWVLKKLNHKITQNLFDYKKLTLIDIYHSPLEAIPIEVKSFKKIKRVFTSHDLLPFIKPDLAPSRFYDILKPAYDSIDPQTSIIAVSNSTKNDLLNYRIDIREEQIKVVYPAASESLFFQNKGGVQFRFLKNKYQFNFDGYILCLNRIQKYKNTQLVIDAYVHLVNENQLKDIGLVLIGTFETLDAKSKMKESYAKYNILFIDYIPDFELSLFYSNCITFAYMSLFEGFGLPVLEAMQCGAPVICSNLKSLPEITGDSCIQLDPFDQDAFSQSLLGLCSDESLRNRLSVAGIARSKMFSWKKNCSEIVSFYNEIIDRK